MVEHGQISYETPRFVELVGADGFKPALGAQPHPFVVSLSNHEWYLDPLTGPGLNGALSERFARRNRHCEGTSADRIGPYAGIS